MSQRKPKKEFASYEETSAWAQAEGIATQAQWNARRKQGVPPNIPSTPAMTYREEFKTGGWGRFLGTGSVSNSNRQFASYEEASQWAKSEGINSKTQWAARCRQELPSNIPSNPNQIYPAEFKDGGWGRFFGTGRLANFNRQFAPYEEASAWAKSEGITSQDQWRTRSKQGLPLNIPSKPERVYNNFYSLGGFNGFFGLKKVSGASKIERCLRHVLEHAFEDKSLSLAQPRAMGASSQMWKVDVFLPTSLLIVEYDGSRYHLNKEDLDNRKTADLLEAGYQVVRIRGSGQKHSLPLLRDGWDVVVQEGGDAKIQIAVVLDHLIDLIKRGMLPLSTDVCRRLAAVRDIELDKINFREVLENYDGFLSYDEASAWAQSEGITSKDHWRARCKQGLPINIPSGPSQTFREEFKAGGWGRFFRTGFVATQNRQFASYEEASVWAKAEGVTNCAQWSARRKQGLPINIPSSPYRTYREEFKTGGWGRFFGTGRLANFNRQFASYEEASQWAKNEGITSKTQWDDRCKQGLPSNIPSALRAVYAEEFKAGGWGRFLGTSRVATFNRQFASYEESSRWAQNEGITTTSQWKTRCRQGLPANIPSNPNQAYPKEFKTGGMGRFLGTGRVAVFNRQFMSYAEASTWAQNEGVSSKSQWHARSKQGLPSNIPSSPGRTYREEFKDGGFQRFLKTGTYAPQPTQPTTCEEPAAISAPSLPISDWRARRQKAVVEAPAESASKSVSKSKSNRSLS